MGYFDRFDICEAYFALEYDWNVSGMLQERPTCRRRMQSVGVQLDRMGFEPRCSLSSRDTLTENGKDIYDSFVRRHGMRRHGLKRQTARFWWWHRGWVKLSLRPGESLLLQEGGPTDEGYSYTRTVFTCHDGIVSVESDTQSRDCDGRLDRSYETYCPVDRLHVEVPYTLKEDGSEPEPTIRTPAWAKGRRSQRDYTAEAAGY